MTKIPWLRPGCLDLWRETLLILGGTVTLSCMMLWTFPALAVTWYPTAEASQGQQQQLVDLDSMESLGLGQVRVASLYIDRRSGAAKQTAYVTEYDCQKRQFRDVQHDGSRGSAEWFPVDPDPLNAATMDYLCNLIAR